jgi:hypothetical protein
LQDLEQSLLLEQLLVLLMTLTLFPQYRLVDKDMRQPPLLGFAVRLSGSHISTVWTLRKVK